MDDTITTAVLRAGTVTEALEAAAHTGRGITFIDAASHEESADYAALSEAALRGASGLRARGVEPGDRVCVLGPTSPDLVAALFSVWRAGAAAVVLPLPRRRSELEGYAAEVAGRLESCGAGLLAIAPEFEPYVQAGGCVPRTVGLAELLASAPADPGPGPAERDTALLQFTSGTTGRSRAVTLSHSNLLTNLAGAGAAARIRSGDVMVSWLPLFHDMGLIGMLLGALAFELPLVLQPTESFLASPQSWMRAVDRFGGTVTAAPNFGYGLAARTLRRFPQRLDLNRLRLACNGAEPVDMATVAAFTEAASGYGLAPSVMTPMFGLAEATLAVTICDPSDPVCVEHVSREALETSQTIVWTQACDPQAKPMVSCGRPIPRAKVAVLDADGKTLPAGRVGEVCVQGPSVMSGYWDDGVATAQALSGGWLHTGDQGYWGRDGLVICGRLKDMIILGGRNLYPEDYERWAERVPGVRRGNVIAFALPAAERMVVVAETTVDSSDAGVVASEVLQILRSRLPRGPEEVVLVPPGTLPKTSSGKRRRSECRDRYSAGRLDAVASAGR